MRSIIFIIALFISVSGYAQYNFEETFEANNNGWTEVVLDDYETLITEGVLRVKSKKADKTAESHTFLDFDASKNFKLECIANAKNINSKGCFGIMVNYKDDGNYIAFLVWEGTAIMHRYVDGKMVGSIRNDIKLKKQKKAEVELMLTQNFKGLSFEVNGMEAINARFVNLDSSGVGFCVVGEQTVEFDNLKIVQ